MKKLSLIIFSLLLYFSSFGQRTNTIVNENSAWAVLNVNVCPECPIWTEYFYFEDDSIVESNLYKKVFSCNDILHENIQYEGLIREQNKKTYFIPTNSETEYLLYDFSMERLYTKKNQPNTKMKSICSKISNIYKIEV